MFIKYVLPLIFAVSLSQCTEKKNLPPNEFYNYGADRKQITTYIDRYPFGSLDEVIVGGGKEPEFFKIDDRKFPEYEKKFRKLYKWYVDCWEKKNKENN